MPYYAVREGRHPGIYNTWTECKREVDRFPGPIFRKFDTYPEAQEFIKDGPPIIHTDYNIYTDGSFYKGRYSWAFAVYYKNGELIYEENGLGQSPDAVSMRNIAGEIEAVYRAVLWAESHMLPMITIYHDYIGLSKWATGEWKTNLIETKAYAQFMRPRLDRIQFKRVRGHHGIEGNERVDILAKMALGLR